MVQGSYRVDIYVNIWVTVFGFPFSQEEVFGSFNEFGRIGRTDEAAVNFVNAVLDDGGCVLDLFGDVNGDNSVTVGDLLEILAEFGCTEGCSTDISGTDPRRCPTCSIAERVWRLLRLI